MVKITSTNPKNIVKKGVKFNRLQHHRFMRLDERWRKPKGIDCRSRRYVPRPRARARLLARPPAAPPLLRRLLRRLLLLLWLRHRCQPCGSDLRRATSGPGPALSRPASSAACATLALCGGADLRGGLERRWMAHQQYRGHPAVCSRAKRRLAAGARRGRSPAVAGR
jgi:hypothetical protein